MGKPGPFQKIYDHAAGRKGGAAAFEETLTAPASSADLRAIPDDRWLSMMSKCVFQAGFNWKVVESKWPRFEEVFERFDPARMAFKTDEDLDAYLKLDGIVRHGTKIRSIQQNAAFVRAVAAEKGSFGALVADWPASDYVGLLWLLKKRASRLGGHTGMYFLRFMGVDSFITSRDVVRALIREGIVDRDPASKRDLDAVQAAFNAWMEESGRPMTQISRTLACSVA